MPPSTPRHHHYLTRDERLQAKTLYQAGYSYKLIQQQLGFSIKQVRNAIKLPLTPKKRPGRRSKLSSEQIQELIAFIRQSRVTRRMQYYTLAAHFYPTWGVSEDCIRRALKAAGYSRKRALYKPPLTEENKRARLQWALDHQHWDISQWNQILWSDETWVIGGYKRIYVTRQHHEALDYTCLVDKIRRRRGQMFWACFNGSNKGPAAFWKKDWGRINARSYCRRILPLVDIWMIMNPGLLFMQDNASSHTAQYTKEELKSRGIQTITWPPFSPDLNPIESVWAEMKRWIGDAYPRLTEQRIRPRDLERIVGEAWAAITPEHLQSIVNNMGRRCEAVIAAQGGHIPF